MPLPSWYVLAVRPQHERSVAQDAGALGYETLLPLYRARRTWSDRIKIIEVPVFGPYVFCRFPYRDRVRLLNLPGVRSILKFGNTPAEVSETEIGSLMAMMASGLPLQPWPYLKVGDRVRIGRGALRGVEGTLTRFGKHSLIVVSVNALSRAVAVEIERGDVEPVRSQSRAPDIQRSGKGATAAGGRVLP